MGIFSDTERRLCPKCKHVCNEAMKECAACGATLHEPRERAFVRGKTAGPLIGKISLYMSALASFMLAMAEGFIHTDSIAMAGNLGISLGVLLICPWCNDAPRRSLAAAISLIITTYIFLHFTDLSVFSNWVELRVAVLAFPVLTLGFLISIRK